MLFLYICYTVTEVGLAAVDVVLVPRMLTQFFSLLARWLTLCPLAYQKEVFLSASILANNRFYALSLLVCQPIMNYVCKHDSLLCFLFASTSANNDFSLLASQTEVFFLCINLLAHQLTNAFSL